MELSASWLGEVDYLAAWDLQRSRFEARLEERVPDSLLLLEHPPTYTRGRRTAPGDLVFSEQECAQRGIAVYDVDRGGRITYHGPGQLVGYPIVALEGRYDVLSYLRALEAALIAAVGELGVEAVRDPEHTGVWVGSRKLAAIGVKITRGVSMHGFALNVTTDLDMFGGIVPCGIPDRGVTSILAETGYSHPVREVATLCAERLAGILDRSLRWVPPERLDPGAAASAVAQGAGGPAAGAPQRGVVGHRP